MFEEEERTSSTCLKLIVPSFLTGLAIGGLLTLLVLWI